GNQSNNNAPAQSAPTVNCSKCGAPLPANAKFCHECGNKIVSVSANEIICPKCGEKTAKGKFCINCGTPLANKCPNCGTDVPAGGKFCLECGTKIGG
ncbi:MAG: zinc ribbon domain-containing protein, partial [Clostridia bacterium]|nr:zinc ribbon domain-containing protein [Clostridia bacterium]